MGKRIVFLDATCPEPYSASTLKTSPLGGTEATVIRVAEGLAGRGHEVVVAQAGRITRSCEGGAFYVGFEDAKECNRPDVVISLRLPSLVSKGRSISKDAKQILWLHDFNQLDLVKQYGQHLIGHKTRVIAVSRTHQMITSDALLTQLGAATGVTTGFIYNPVDVSACDHSTISIVQDKLVYFSSPHKGLELTLKQFEAVRRTYPEMRLYIANPGYLPDRGNLPEGCINLGALPHPQILKHVKEAFAVFHCNTNFPETFGLVAAEALALGTPILTHKLGALPEVIRDNEMFVNCRDEKAVVDRITRWKQQRPVTKVNPEFDLESVLTQWEAEISE